MMHTTTNDYSGAASDVSARRFPPYMLLGIGIIFLVLGPGPNMVLTAGALLALMIISALCWRPGEPPILLYVFVFQWLEASIWIFYATYFDAPVDDGSATGAGRQFATVLVLLGLVAQAIGVRLAAGPWTSFDRELVESQLRRITQNTWLKVYIGAVLVAAVAGYLSRVIPGLSQPLLALVYLRWAAYVILTFATFFRADARKSLWFLVFALELVFSIGGYFSSFKFVFLLTFLGIACAQVRMSGRIMLRLAAVVSAALVCGVVWSSVKDEYRFFVSGGQRAQIITVEYSERVAKLGELTSNLHWEDFKYGLDVLMKRIDYVEYFGAVTNYVPGVLPHTYGARWFDAMTRPFMPRLFFPEKAAIDESFITNKFTGLSVAGMEQGTQISIGYMAETYIDFGQYGMMPVLFIWGMFLGSIYKWLVAGAYSRGVLGMGLVTAIFVMTAGAIGNSLAKLVGGLAVSLLVTWLFNRFFVPRWLPWIRT